jgi:ABC-type bacteriocin/lantibiotic exporter with double-glycine peptidase domain
MRIGIFKLPLLLVCASAFVCAAEPGIWLDVPFVKQEKNGCGAASIAMVVQFWQRQQGMAVNADSDPTEIQRSLYSADERGIRASAMEHFFQQHGFRNFAFAGTPDDLRQHLEKGRPLIVALKPGDRAPLHYLVVVGLNLEENLVLVNDPAQRKMLKRDLSGFESEWKGTGHWMLLAVPQSEGPSSAQ